MRPPQKLRAAGVALLALAFLLAAIPAIPFWVELAVIVVGAVLIVCALPWNRL